MKKDRSNFADVQRRRRVERVIFGLLNEELGMDASVLMYSVVDKGRTRTRCVTFGNSLACRGLVEWIADEVDGETIDDAVMLDDEDDDESDD